MSENLSSDEPFNSDEVQDTGLETERSSFIEGVEFTKVTIVLPKSMHKEIKERADLRLMSVPELMRRALSQIREVR